MALAVLSLHLVVCICLIGLVLLQRSEGGALGMGGGSGSLMSGRGAADALARMTSIAGGFFLVTSLSLTVISGANASRGPSPLDLFPRQEQPAAPTPVPVEPTRPDPTESSAPEATGTQLAEFTPPNSVAEAIVPVAPPPTQASERAAPLTASQQQAANLRPTQPVTQRQPVAGSQRPAVTAAQRPATTAQRPATQPAAASPQTGTRTTAARTPLILPNSSGGSLAEPAPTAPESVDVGGGLEAVRRERAGPEQ